MRSASDQLAKRAAFDHAFDQMRNVWSNARTIGQMRALLGAFDQSPNVAFGQMPHVL